MGHLLLAIAAAGLLAGLPPHDIPARYTPCVAGYRWYFPAHPSNAGIMGIRQRCSIEPRRPEPPPTHSRRGIRRGGHSDAALDLSEGRDGG